MKSDNRLFQLQIVLIICLFSSLSSCQNKSALISSPSNLDPISKTGLFQYYDSPTVDSVFQRCINNTYLPECGRAAEYLSFIGEQAYADQIWNKDNQRTFLTPTDTTVDIQEWETTDALNFILSQVTDQRVIMINEAHHKPEGRVFTRRLIKALQTKGFNYLGLEGLKEDGEQLMSRGFPNTDSGFYIQEPQYGNLIREALRSGYTVFDYDNKGGRGKERETNQAAEIYAILQNDPNAKVVVHAGWGHIREDQDILGGLMAYEFKKISGIDPLTINQSRYISQSKPEYQNPLYTKLDLPKHPSLLINKSTKEPYVDRFTDLLVFHNDDSHLFEHTDFFQSIKLKAPSISEATLVFVYLEEELGKNKPVPAFITELEPNQKEFIVQFPFPGSYNIYLAESEQLVPFKSVAIK